MLDSGPLGNLSNPSTSTTATKALAWARSLLEAGHQIVVPEISDYEVRRVLLRANLADGVRRLDELGVGLGYAPVTSAMWRRAAFGPTAPWTSATTSRSRSRATPGANGG